MKKQNRKYRWLRRLLRVLAVVLILFIGGCFVFDYYIQFRRSDEELMENFAKRNLDVTIGYYTSHGRTLRYMHTGADSLPALLFLHGSPGSMSYYGGRFADSRLNGRFKMLAVDRPGYGYSGFGKPERSIEKQAAMIRPILVSLHRLVKPVIIVGGSYGSSVACRLAMDYPELVDGLVLTGPSLGPGLEKYFWFTQLAEQGSVRWFVPRLLRSANTEKVYHKRELEKMLPRWKDIRVPVAYIQGEGDKLIDTANAGFARQQMVNVPYLNIRFIKNRQHRLAQFEWPSIRDAILKVYDEAVKNRNDDAALSRTE
jgi:pimeloyl-ACP methyl ester carboxylesterase